MLGTHRFALALLAIGATSCLPKDTRPPPAEVYVQVSADESVRTGFTTTDGWDVQLSRFVVGIGRASISGDSCNPYSEANYERVLDLQQPNPQKLALMYGLGQCDFSFGIVHPVSDSIIGQGVTADEALTMRTAGNDLYTNFAGQLTGINTLIKGTATKGTRQLSFSWEFRLDNYFQGCAPTSDAGAATGINLHGGDVATIDLLVSAEAFFNVLVQPLDVASGPTQFNVFADADTLTGNNDGQVTLDELAAVPLTELAKVSPPITDCLDGTNCPFAGMAGVLDASAPNWSSVVPDASVGQSPVTSTGSFVHSPLVTPGSIGDYVYYYLQPLIVRYQDAGQCSHSTVRRGRGR